MCMHTISNVSLLRWKSNHYFKYTWNCFPRSLLVNILFSSIHLKVNNVDNMLISQLSKFKELVSSATILYIYLVSLQTEVMRTRKGQLCFSEPLSPIYLVLCGIPGILTDKKIKAQKLNDLLKVTDNKQKKEFCSSEASCTQNLPDTECSLWVSPLGPDSTKQPVLFRQCYTVFKLLKRI